MIRDARQGAGLSQAELARRAGTSQAAVARYERGHAEPAVSTLARLLSACGRRLELATTAAPALAGLDASPLRRERRRLLERARMHGARNLRVFGSVARGEARPDSDIDLLVDLEPGRTLLDLVALERDASEILGVEVDVAVVDMLREPVRREALRDAVPV